MDYIGTVDRAARHTKAILQQVGMWESFGAHYRVSERGKIKGRLTCTWPPEPLKPGEVAVGFQQQISEDGKGGMDTQGHSTGSRSKLDQYYTPELLAKVKKLYWMDFALWDALKEADDEGLVNGKGIAFKLNPECS